MAAINVKKSFGSITGIASIAVFIFFTSAAIIFTPGYDNANQYFSELGIGSAAVFFNVGTVLTAILFMFFFAGMWSRFGGNMFSKAGSAAGILSCIGLIGVGVFPMTLVELHDTSALVFFTAVGISLILIGTSMLKTRMRIYSYLGFLISLVDAYFLVDLSPMMQKVTVILLLMWAAALSANILRNEIKGEPV